MPKKLDLTGRKYGQLTVIKEHGKDHRGYTWLCKCDCGEENIIAVGDDLRSGHKTSCGCLRWQGTPKHGLSDSAIRQAYYNMKKRCDHPKNKSYKNYGGRGITYCEKWKTFKGFLDDMLESYEVGLSLDRIDVNGNYNKENCRWADKIVQANNTRTNHIVEYKGEKLTIAELCRKYHVNYSLLNDRINEGWEIEKALCEKTREVITYNGVTKTVAEFAENYGMTYHQLKKRLMRGWEIERALTQPLRKRSK